MVGTVKRLSRDKIRAVVHVARGCYALVISGEPLAPGDALEGALDQVGPSTLKRSDGSIVEVHVRRAKIPRREADWLLRRG